MANTNDIVDVSIQIGTNGLQARNFGVTLHVTTDDTLPPSNSLQVFTDFEDIQNTFAVGSEPYEAGEVYFGQDTVPANLLIGRWFDTPTAASLVGGVYTGTLADLQAISDGSLEINGDTITGIDLTSAVSFDDVTMALTAAMNGGTNTNGSAQYDAGTKRFSFVNNVVGAISTLTYASATGQGTDLSSLLLWDSATAQSLNQGQDLETIEEALARFQQINNTFYFITLTPQYNNTSIQTDLSAWVLAEQSTNTYFYYAESTDPNVLNTDETSSIFADLFAQQSTRTAGDWNSPVSDGSSNFTNYLSVASASVFSNSAKQLNNGQNVLINPDSKPRALIQASIVTSTQQAELTRKRVNNFSPLAVGASSPTVEDIYREGYCFANDIWQDVRIGTDWWANAIQLSVLNLKLQSKRIPQTVQGQTQVVAAIDAPCQQAVRNGLLAPGQVSEVVKDQIISITGNSQFSGFLPQGYLIYPLPLSTLSESDRIARKLPIFYVWGKGSGAVNSIVIRGFLDQ